MIPSIEIFEGIGEEVSNVSLRRDKFTGVKSVLMTFKQLNSLDKFNSFTKKFNKGVLLKDSEGTISVEPDSFRLIFGGDEGDELQGVECEFAIEQEEHWERFMRFMNRYAEANGMGYGDK